MRTSVNIPLGPSLRCCRDEWNNSALIKLQTPCRTTVFYLLKTHLLLLYIQSIYVFVCSLQIWFIAVTCRCDEYRRTQVPYKSLCPDTSQAPTVDLVPWSSSKNTNKETKVYLWQMQEKEWWQENTMTTVLIQQKHQLHTIWPFFQDLYNTQIQTWDT